MPIKKENAHLYRDDWTALSYSVRKAADWRCVGSPKYPDCRAKNGEPHPVTASKVVLTVGHFDHDPTNNAPGNLKAWCQRCHNAHDAEHRRANAAKTRRDRKAAGDLFDE